MLLIDFLIFVIGCTGVVLSSSFVVKSLIRVEEYYHLREFVVGFLVVGVLTSFPELSVGIISALSGISSLSFGDILGSNVINIALVMGLVAFIGKSIKFEAQLEKTTLFMISAMVFLPLILFLDQELSRIDGVILISAFVLYVIRLLMIRKKFKKADGGNVHKIRVYKNMAIFIVSLLVLIGSARLLVYSASEIALALSFPLVLIGLLIVSVGTSLPELTLELGCVLRGHCSVALGDLLGSLAFNSALILGVVSLISPIHAQFSSFAIASVFITISLVTFLFFARTGRIITRKEGMILLFIFVLFIISNLLFR
jgi:cation:H+ antiporter